MTEAEKPAAHSIPADAVFRSKTDGNRWRRDAGGRKKGSRNKRTRELEQAKAKAAAIVNGTVPGAFEGDAHALLMTIYKDPEQEVHRRLDAAKAALPYEKPRLASVQNTGPGDGAIETIVRVIEVPAKEAPG